MGVNLWLKWRLATSPAMAALADLALSDGDAVSPRDVLSGDEMSGDGLVITALAALAGGDPEHAIHLLDDARPSAAHATVLGDARATQHNWPAALAAYRRAVELDHTDPVARIGRAVAAIHNHDTAAAVADLRPLHAAQPDNPVITHYFVLAQVHHVRTVCAVSRDERTVITSPAQLAECERICTELANVRVDDTDLAAAVDALRQQVINSRTWAWREYGSNGGVLVVVLLISLAGVVFGGVINDLWLAIGAAILGGGAVFLYVVTNRRPAWELRAQDMANMITSPGRAGG